MSMTTCGECKAEISSTAETCPRCGARQANAARGRAILFGIILLVVIITIGQCSSPNQTTETPNTAAPTVVEPVAPAQPEITDHALAVCSALKNSGATECELTVFSQAIDARVNVSASDAAVLCKGITVLVRQQTTAFNGTEWQIRVFSPFSGDHPLATCPLSPAP